MEKTSVDSNGLLKWFGIGAVTFTIGYFSYKIICNNFLPGQKLVKKNKSRERLHTNLTNNTEYSDYYFDKFLEVQMIEQFLGDPDNLTLDQIYLHSHKIASDQFIKYTKQIRERRRLVRKLNQAQYINIILTYEEEIEDLIIRSRQQLAEYLKLTAIELVQLEKAYDGEDLRELQRISEQNLQEKLLEVKPKKISKEVFNKIMEEHISFVKNKMYERIQQNLINEVNIGQDKILKVVMALLQDITFEKYGYEWEDIQNKINEERLKGEKLVSERDKYLKHLKVDISDFNYDSFESADDQYGDISAKMSIPTAERSGSFSD